DMNALRAALPADRQTLFNPVPVIGKAGEASFHHSHTVYGSYRNESGRPRRAVVINYMGPETRCADGTVPLLKGVPLIPEGALIEGDYFPIVFDREKLNGLASFVRSR